MAERLYGGDWRAAGIKFLREERILVDCLCNLKGTLDAMNGWGFAVANDRGRERVLDVVKGNRRSRVGWAVRIPDGTADGEPRAAAEAALAQEGFSAESGAALELLAQLAAVSAGWWRAAGHDLQSCMLVWLMASCLWLYARRERYLGLDWRAAASSSTDQVGRRSR